MQSRFVALLPCTSIWHIHVHVCRIGDGRKLLQRHNSISFHQGTSNRGLKYRAATSENEKGKICPIPYHSPGSSVRNSNGAKSYREDLGRVTSQTRDRGR